jgi:hypothetical protein
LKPNLPSFGILERRSCHKNTITFDGAQPSHTIDKIPPSLVDREEENLENKLEELALTKNIYTSIIKPEGPRRHHLCNWDGNN